MRQERAGASVASTPSAQAPEPPQAPRYELLNCVPLPHELNETQLSQQGNAVVRKEADQNQEEQGLPNDGFNLFFQNVHDLLADLDDFLGPDCQADHVDNANIDPDVSSGLCKSAFTKDVRAEGLRNSFEGRDPPMSFEELQRVRDSTLFWDLAIAFPNPDWHPTDAKVHHICYSCCACDKHCHRSCFSSLLCCLNYFFAWEAPDLTLRSGSGVSEKQARKLFEDALRGHVPCEKSDVDIFLMAFRNLSEVPGRNSADHAGNALDPRQAHSPPLSIETPSSHESRKKIIRCMSHGGTLQPSSVVKPRPIERIFNNILPNDSTVANQTQTTDYAHSSGDTAACRDFLSLVRNVLVTKLSRAGLAVELVFSVDYKHIYALVSASEESFLSLAKQLKYPLTVDLARADPYAVEPCDRHYRLLEELFINDPEVKRLLSEAKIQRDEVVVSLHSQPCNTEVNNQRCSFVRCLAGHGRNLPSHAQRDAFLHYLRARASGSSAREAMIDAEKKTGERLVSLWEVLGMRAPVAGVRLPHITDYNVASVPLRIFPAASISRGDLSSHFSPNDRVHLLTAAIEREVDLLYLADHGYILDFLTVSQRCTPNTSLHQPSHSCLKSWSQRFRAACKPLDCVESSDGLHGQAMALYFLFIRHLTVCLVVIAVFGIIVHIVGVSQPAWVPELGIVYSVFLQFWAEYWVLSWRHVHDRLLLQWGLPQGDRDCFPTIGFRMRFRGILRRSPVTGNDEEDDRFPIAKRACLYITVIIMILFGFIEVALVVYISALRSFIGERLSVSALGYNFSSEMVAMINVFQIILLNYVFNQVALGLTYVENHKTPTGFARSFTLKSIFLQMVNSYASIIYLAFCSKWAAQQLGVDASCAPSDASSSSGVLAYFFWDFGANGCFLYILNRQLAALLLIFAAKNVLEVGVPIIQHKLVKRISTHSNSKSGGDLPLPRSPKSQAKLVVNALDRDMGLPRFESPAQAIDGPSDDYAEIAVLLGFLLLFSGTFPLAAPSILICCGVEVWVDSFKAQKLVRPPVPSPLTNIGVWKTVFQLLVWVSPITNMILLVYTSGVDPRRWDGAVGVTDDLRPLLVLVLLFGAAHLAALICTWRRPSQLVIIETRMKLARAEPAEPRQQSAPAEGAAWGHDGRRSRTVDLRVRSLEDWVESFEPRRHL